jgi:hypothetical protein
MINAVVFKTNVTEVSVEINFANMDPITAIATNEIMLAVNNKVAFI